MEGANSGEVGDLLTARRAARDEHAIGGRARAPPAAVAVRRWPARPRSVLACSRTSLPCRSSRHRDRRPSRRECARAAPWRRGSSPIAFWWQWPCRTTVAGPERSVRCGPAVAALSLEPLLEQHAHVRRPPRLPAIVGREQIRRVLANRREATGLEEHERLPARRERIQPIGVLAGATSGLAKQALRDQRPPAADIRRERDAVPEPLHHVEAGHADRRGESNW